MEPTKDLIPKKVRQTLYIVGVAMLITQPFIEVFTNKEISTAFIMSAAAIGSLMGVTALTHPTKTRVEEYEKGFSDGIYEAVENYYSKDDHEIL